MDKEGTDNYLRVKLVSDFIDYYDHWFDSFDTDLIYERQSTGGMGRLQMLKYLQSLGLLVPDFGQVKELHQKWQEYVVIYLNERAHRGEGKTLLPFSAAMEQYPNHLATEYIPALPSGHGLSWRYLQVGDKVFWVEYASSSDWRSNCGDVTIKVLSREKDSYNDKIKHPLYAVDFVPAGNKLYAVDFNVAPGIKGTGVEELLPAREAAEAIKKAVILFKNP